MKRLLNLVTALALFSCINVWAAEATAKPTDQKANETLAAIDERITFKGDYTGLVKVREIRKDGTDTTMEFRVHRRDATNDFLLFTIQPPNSAGTGFLRIGENLWFYSSTVGQWSRSTRRASVTSTVACQSDFDRSTLALDYEAKDEGVDELNGKKFRKLYLTAKPGRDPLFLRMHMWVDQDNNVAKKVGYAPSGRVLRTDIVKSYGRTKEPSGRVVTFPREVSEYAEEEGVEGVVRYEQVDLNPLTPNIFTKAWLESKSR